MCLDAAQLLGALPTVWVWASLSNPDLVPFKIYYALHTLAGSVQINSVVLAACADVVEPALRTRVFVIVMAGRALGMVVAAGVGGALPAAMAAQMSATTMLVVTVATALFLPGALSSTLRVPRCWCVYVWRSIRAILWLAPPRLHPMHIAADMVAFASLASPAETLPPGKRAQALERTPPAAALQPQAALVALRDTLAVLFRSRLFMQLALIMALSGMVMECVEDILFNYLNLTLGFDASDNARVLILLGVGAVLVQVR